MKLKNWREIAYLLASIACIQTIILTIIAMFFYAGGTVRDPTYPGYSFWGNYFSDLGRTVAFSGRSNLISMVIFTIALCIMVPLSIPFFVAIPHFFREQRDEKRLSILGSIFGIVSALLMLGVAFTPWDLYEEAHNLFARTSFIASFIMALLFTITILKNNVYPNRYAFVYIAFLIFMGIHLVLIFFVVDYTTEESYVIYASTQKIMVYSFFVCFLIQSYGAWKLEKSHNIP
ncbi:MAG: hypothetical protein ACFFHV_16240 [Promethearchaeota archaeon]